MNNQFVKLANIDFSNITIQNLSQEFEYLKNKIIEKKNDGEYRTREERELFNKLSELCDINRHIIRITSLTALDIEDEEFDIRDFTLESEINHLVSDFSEIIVLQTMEGLDDFPLQF